MTILRTYMCQNCAFRLEVELRSDQWDQPPPECPVCAGQEMGQHFKPPAIGGSLQSRAAKVALDIAEKDYGIADIQADGKQGERPKVRFKDDPGSASSWVPQTAALAQAMALGRESRLRYGDGLDVLQQNLKSGAQPDLIELSKRRSMKVW